MALIPFAILAAVFFSWGVIDLDHNKQFREAHKIAEQCQADSPDVKLWEEQFKEGKMSKDEFSFLVEGRASVCSVIGNKKG